jgi:hypothetical protein
MNEFWWCRSLDFPLAIFFLVGPVCSPDQFGHCNTLSPRLENTVI